MGSSNAWWMKDGFKLYQLASTWGVTLGKGRGGCRAPMARGDGWREPQSCCLGGAGQPWWDRGQICSGGFPQVGHIRGTGTWRTSCVFSGLMTCTQLSPYKTNTGLCACSSAGQLWGFVLRASFCPPRPLAEQSERIFALSKNYSGVPVLIPLTYFQPYCSKALLAFILSLIIFVRSFSMKSKDPFLYRNFHLKMLVQ